MGATESPGPELLPEYVELAWPAVQAPQSWKCLGGVQHVCFLGSHKELGGYRARGSLTLP